MSAKVKNTSYTSLGKQITPWSKLFTKKGGGFSTKKKLKLVNRKLIDNKKDHLTIYPKKIDQLWQSHENQFNKAIKILWDKSPLDNVHPLVNYCQEYDLVWNMG